MYIDEIHIQGEMAYVRVKQVNRSTSLDYPDNRVYCVNLVVQRNGQRKLGPGAILRIEYFNEHSVFNKYAYSEVEFIHGEGDEAVIRYQLATRKTRGPDAFDNSVMDIVEVVKKDSDGRWKFAFTELISVDYREEALEEVFGD